MKLDNQPETVFSFQGQVKVGVLLLHSTPEWLRTEQGKPNLRLFPSYRSTSIYKHKGRLGTPCIFASR